MGWISFRAVKSPPSQPFQVAASWRLHITQRPKAPLFLIKNLDTSSFQALEFSDKDYSLVSMKTSPSAELQPNKYRSWAVHLCPSLHKHRSGGKARHVPKHTHRHLPFCLLLTRNLALPANFFFLKLSHKDPTPAARHQRTSILWASLYPSRWS